MSLSSPLPLLPLICSPFLRGGGAARALKGRAACGAPQEQVGGVQATKGIGEE